MDRGTPLLEPNPVSSDSSVPSQPRFHSPRPLHRQTHKIHNLTKTYLLDMVHRNDKEHQCSDQFKTTLLFSHRKSFPELPLFIDLLNRKTSCSPFCYVTAIIFIQRLQKAQMLYLTSNNAHCVILTALLISSKFIDDHYYANSYHATLLGIPFPDLNAMECQFLAMIRFRLFVCGKKYDRTYREIRDRVRVLATNQSDRRTQDSFPLPPINRPILINPSSSSLNLHSKSFFPRDMQEKLHQEKQLSQERRERRRMANEDTNCLSLPSPSTRSHSHGDITPHSINSLSTSSSAPSGPLTPSPSPTHGPLHRKPHQIPFCQISAVPIYPAPTDVIRETIRMKHWELEHTGRQASKKELARMWKDLFGHVPVAFHDER